MTQVLENEELVSEIIMRYNKQEETIEEHEKNIDKRIRDRLNAAVLG